MRETNPMTLSRDSIFAIRNVLHSRFFVGKIFDSRYLILEKFKNLKSKI